MKRYSKRNTRRSVFHTAIFRAVSQGATLAGYAVLVRGMSEHDFGVLSLLYALLPVIGIAASLGIEQTLRRYQPEYLMAERHGAAARLVGYAASARFATNLLVLGVILFAWNWLAPTFQIGPYRGEFMIFCLLVILHFQASILQLSLSSHMLQGYSVGGTAVLSVSKLVAYGVLMWRGDLTLVNAIVADIAAYGLMYVWLQVLHVRHCAPPASAPRDSFTASERRRLLKYSLYNNFNDAGVLLLTSRTDNFFLAALMNPVAVGAYAFYVRLNEMISQLLPVRQFSNVIQPLLFAVPAAEAREKIPRYFAFLMNVTMVLQLPMLVYSIAYHSEIVEFFFGGKFSESSWLLPVIVAFSTANRVADPVLWSAQYQEKASLILFSKIFGIYNAVAMLLLVPVAGIYGAAIATGTAQVMKNGFIWWNVRDMARWVGFWRMTGWAALVWSVALVLCLAARAAASLPPLLDLMVGAVVCATAILVYARGPGLSHADRTILGSVFHGREARLLGWLGVVTPQASRRERKVEP